MRGDLGAGGVEEARFEARHQAAGRAEVDVGQRGGAHDGAGLGEAVGLADGPVRVEGVEGVGGLGAERGGAGEDFADGGEVVRAEGGGVVDELDDDRGHEEEVADAVRLDGAQAGRELEAREHHHAVALVQGRVPDHDQGVDVAEGEDPQRGVPEVGAVAGVAAGLVEGGDLECVVYDVAVGDHDPLWEAGRAGGVAEEGGLAGALACGPAVGFQGWGVGAEGDEVVDGFVAGRVGGLRHGKNEDAAVWNAELASDGQRGLEKRRTREDAFGIGVAELVCEFRCAVRCVGGGVNGIDGVTCPCHEDGVKLSGY